MAIPPLVAIGTRYLLHLVGVLLWPLTWAVAGMITQRPDFAPVFYRWISLGSRFLLYWSLGGVRYVSVFSVLSVTPWLFFTTEAQRPPRAL